MCSSFSRIEGGKSHREDLVENLCHIVNLYYLWYDKSVEVVWRELIASIGRRLENEGFLAKQHIGKNNARKDDDQSMYLKWAREGHLYKVLERDSI